MRLLVTIAVGANSWGEMALNLAASIKGNTPEQKTLIIYDESAIQSIKPCMDNFFDYGYLIEKQSELSSTALAFKLKTELYDILNSVCNNWEQAVFLDADSIVLPGKNVGEWFDKHSGDSFCAYCNDQYNYGTKKRKRADYTFWCDVERAKEYFKIPVTSRMAQWNTSFMYIQRGAVTAQLFHKAKRVWADDGFEHAQYKGAKPDELCFNIASAYLGIYPKQNTYRPVYMQFASSKHNRHYAMQYFRVMSFAGNGVPADYLVELYNELSNYYREQAGIAHPFLYNVLAKAKKEVQYHQLKPIRRRTIFRRSEIPNSDAGVFNPCGIKLPVGGDIVLMRKEKNFDVYNSYAATTAYPHLYNYDGDGTELLISGFDENVRVEDFRVFNLLDTTFVNHTVVEGGGNSKLKCKIALSTIQKGKNGSELSFFNFPELPIATNEAEKNWLFYSDNTRIYCIYSLSPYLVFYIDPIRSWTEWRGLDVSEAGIDWFHKGAFVCGSTNPIQIGKYRLLFYHTKENGIYYHGAALLCAESNEMLYSTKLPIEIAANSDGMHKGLIFISGAQYFERGDLVRVFYGEGDSHACYNDYSAYELIELIKNN